jgi:curli biogenesis system outer membrane secretion channel CsgG
MNPLARSSRISARVLLALALLLLSPPALFAQFAAESAQETGKKRKVAILEFQTVSDLGGVSVKGRIVSEKITTAAVKSGFFDVVERHLIQRILDENEFGKDGISGTNAQKIGLLLGADAVLSGVVTEYKDQLSIDARLIEVSTGAILMADEAFARNDLQSITEAAKTVFAKMVGVVAPGKSAPPAQTAVQPPAPATVQTPPPPPASTNAAGMRYPEASQRALSAAELAPLSKAELKLMRNEIYARHGYIFQTKDMRDYFSRQPWYTPRQRAVEQFFSLIEQNNVMLIKSIEDQKR